MRQAPVNPAELLTLASATAAMLGLCAPLLGGATATQQALMVCAVAASELLDRLDGKLARRLGVSSARGARLDTLADLLAFGAVPVVALVHAYGRTALPIALLYALGAIWRLARFDDDELRETRFGPAFSGVPTAAAAAAVMVALTLVPALALPIALVCALLMPSRLRYPKGGPGFWPWLVLLPIAVLVALARALAA
jgi:CDP-diacylglycerol--serine O-phosphatidyltransferase